MMHPIWRTSRYHDGVDVIATEALTRRYGKRIGVDGINLVVPEGDIFGFLGSNGAGKTTLIRVLMGFLRPSEGRAVVFGHDCWRRSPTIKRDTGYLPGDLRLYPWLTGAAAMRIVGHIRGMDLRSAGHALADRFSFDMSLRVRKMSRGTRQKLGLIMALVHRPKLLVLDEPTSGLDPIMQNVLGEFLRELSRHGTTVFFSSHTLSEVEQLCDRVAIVRAGKIVADETLASLRARAHREAVVTFSNPEAAARAVLPTGARLLDRHDSRVRIELDGPAGPLVKWASAQSIVDLSIGPPDLGTLFRTFYDVSLDAGEEQD